MKIQNLKFLALVVTTLASSTGFAQECLNIDGSYEMQEPVPGFAHNIRINQDQCKRLQIISFEDVNASKWNWIRDYDTYTTYPEFKHGLVDVLMWSKAVFEKDAVRIESIMQRQEFSDQAKYTVTYLLSQDSKVLERVERLFGKDGSVVSEQSFKFNRIDLK